MKRPPDILKLISDFEDVNDHETRRAYFRTHVPWVAAEAYLHIVFKPCPKTTLVPAVKRLRIPEKFVRFYETQNGFHLFSDRVYMYGIHRPGQLLARDRKWYDLPYSIENPRLWYFRNHEHFLPIGGCGPYGSSVVLDRRDLSIKYFYDEGKEPVTEFKSLEDWLLPEIERLRKMFEKKGRLLVDPAATIPLLDRKRR